MNLQPLLDRDCYTAEEWDLAARGLCSKELGWVDRRLAHCGRPSSPDSLYRYCGEHDDVARREMGHLYRRGFE